MHSPPRRTRRGSSGDHEESVQNTLDAFDVPDHVSPATEEDVAEGEAGRALEAGTPPRQESIDLFIPGEEMSGDAPAPEGPPSRALEGIALELRMEGIALTEASSGIVRDELIITIARECDITLDRLELIDSYLSDLELEGRLRSVGDLVVLARVDDMDLISMDLPAEEFLELYRRRYPPKARRDDG